VNTLLAESHSRFSGELCGVDRVAEGADLPDELATGHALDNAQSLRVRKGTSSLSPEGERVRMLYWEIEP